MAGAGVDLQAFPEDLGLFNFLGDFLIGKREFSHQNGLK